MANSGKQAPYTGNLVEIKDLLKPTGTPIKLAYPGTVIG